MDVTIKLHIVWMLSLLPEFLADSHVSDQHEQSGDVRGLSPNHLMWRPRAALPSTIGRILFVGRAVPAKDGRFLDNRFGIDYKLQQAESLGRDTSAPEPVKISHVSGRNAAIPGTRSRSEAGVLARLRVRVIRFSRQSQLRGGKLETVYSVLGLIPGLIWLSYFYRKSHHRPKSFRNLARVFMAGVICTIPTGIMEHLTGAGLVQESLLRSAETSFFLIGPLEELSKLVAVWLAIYRSPDFQEPLDGIIYAGTVAVGFASVENIMYMAHLGPSIIVSRVLFATPAHVMFSAMWGYSMGLARFRRKGELTTILKGFVLAAFLHGTYNFLVAFHPKAAVFSLIPLLVFMAWLMTTKIQQFRRDLPFPSLGKGALIYCPNCGAYTPEEAAACVRCGWTIPLLETDIPRFCGRCRARLDPCMDRCPTCGGRAQPAKSCPPG